MKIKFWIIIIGAILGILSSLNHYGCLFYDFSKTCVMEAWKIPTQYYLELSHFVGSFGFIILSSIVVLIILEWVSEISNYNWNKKILLTISFIILSIFWMLASIGSESTRSIYSFLAIVSAGVLLFKIRNKIMPLSNNTNRENPV